MRTVLITGGAGFIGSHLGEAVLAAGDAVVAVDDLSTGSYRNVGHLSGGDFSLVVASVDDAATSDHATVSFRVIGDGKVLWSARGVKRGQAPRKVEVDLKGVKMLLLIAESRGDIHYGHANWADARLLVTGERPEIVGAPKEIPPVQKEVQKGVKTAALPAPRPHAASATSQSTRPLSMARGCSSMCLMSPRGFPAYVSTV